MKTLLKLASNVLDYYVTFCQFAVVLMAAVAVVKFIAG